MHFIRVMLRYLLLHKALCGVFLFTLILEVAYSAAAPLSLKYLVDDAFAPKNLQVFILILLLLMGGGLLNIVASLFGDYSLGRLSGEVVRRLRTDLFGHLQRQSLPFYQRYRVGDLVTRFSADMGSIERVIRGSLPLFLRETFGVLLGLSMLFAVEWRLTLAVLAGSVLLFVGPKLLQGRAETANVNYKEAQERFSNTIDEMVKGHKTILSLHQQGRFRERARKQIQELFSFGLKVHTTNSLMERLPLTALLLLNGTMIGLGGYLIFRDFMTIGDFIAFFTLFLTVGQSGTNLSYLIPALVESGVSFRRVGEILDQRPAVPEAEDAIELPASVSSIRLDRVTFGYTEDKDQLLDVSLTVEAGSYAAFVGPSGSGKSTALQLISRFYDPRQGTVRMDGYDLRTVSEASLRRAATLVPQETFLFNESIRENLLLDAEGVTDEEMVDAAREARIHDVIAGWPEGYGTRIHLEGASLSGGERQRLSIARALLRKSDVLLLDEVTSALDPHTEADINALIERLRLGGQKTIVAVTHRLASVVNADRIHVFCEGRIVESGTHEELLRLQGLYRSLWEKQHGFNLSEDGFHATVEVERLARLPFFAGIELALLRDISELFATETCKEGEPIVQEGEEGSKFYIIVRGKFEVVKRFAGEGERRVAILQDGDHFGEIALLHDIPRTATVRSLGPSVLLSIRREAFHRLLADHPQILSLLERTLRERM